MALLTSSEGGVELTRSLPIGCEIACTTVTGDTLRGNLVAVDKPATLVVLTEDSPVDTPGVGTANGTIHVINLKNTSKLEVLSEPLAPPPDLPNIDLEKVRKRYETNVAAKLREVQSRGVNVSEQAQQLFDYFRKIYDDIHWKDDVIVVLRDVRISPPYKPENCQGSELACDRIKKLVTKFHKESGTE